MTARASLSKIWLYRRRGSHPPRDTFRSWQGEYQLETYWGFYEPVVGLCGYLGGYGLSPGVEFGVGGDYAAVPNVPKGPLWYRGPFNS